MRISIVNTLARGYCANVRSNVAKRAGLKEEKIRSLNDFETSPMFTEKERAAIMYVRTFATDINKAKDPKVYSDFRKYFNDREAVELESLIALTVYACTGSSNNANCGGSGNEIASLTITASVSTFSPAPVLLASYTEVYGGAVSNPSVTFTISTDNALVIYAVATSNSGGPSLPTGMTTKTTEYSVYDSSGGIYAGLLSSGTYTIQYVTSGYNGNTFAIAVYSIPNADGLAYVMQSAGDFTSLGMQQGGSIHIGVFSTGGYWTVQNPSLTQIDVVNGGPSPIGQYQSEMIGTQTSDQLSFSTGAVGYGVAGMEIGVGNGFVITPESGNNWNFQNSNLCPSIQAYCEITNMALTGSPPLSSSFSANAFSSGIDTTSCEEYWAASGDLTRIANSSPVGCFDSGLSAAQQIGIGIDLLLTYVDPFGSIACHGIYVSLYVIDNNGQVSDIGTVQSVFQSFTNTGVVLCEAVVDSAILIGLLGALAAAGTPFIAIASTSAPTTGTLGVPQFPSGLLEVVAIMAVALIGLTAYKRRNSPVSRISPQYLRQRRISLQRILALSLKRLHRLTETLGALPNI